MTYSESAVNKEKIKARERDFQRCRICSRHYSEMKWGTQWINRVQKHDVHHVFASNDHTIKNFMTLCRACHIPLHTLKRKDYPKYLVRVQQNISAFLEI
jgi:hypothetical protein